ncbi:MAG: M48 family metallopeptidase [Euryarchaeota archaeon]|nr:M48 family metallopeptidase [Euryarchaeota archaeon]
MKTSNDKRLEKALESIGKDYGFEGIQARFYPFKELKSTWLRSGYRAEFRVSDYLETADDGILVDFGHSLLTRASRRNRRERYSEKLRSWLRSPPFIEANRPTYLDRSRNLSLSAEGGAYDLNEIRLALKDRGLINDSSDAFISWTVKDNRHRVGYCSVLMKVIAVSSVLDSESVPPFVPEYVLYHELLHLETSEDCLTAGHGAAFRARERLYPGWREAEEWLKRLSSKGQSATRRFER